MSSAMAPTPPPGSCPVRRRLPPAERLGRTALLAVLGALASACAGRSPVAWIDPAAPANDPGAEGRAVQLTIASLTEDRRARVARTIDAATAAAARRDNPFVEDLSDARERLEELLGATLPMLNVATHLAHARYETDDGLRVTVGPSCRQAPPGARCVRLWDPPRDPIERRVRLLAWPYAFAIVLSGATGDVPALSRALREEQERPESPIGLVIDLRDLPGGGETADLEAAARRSVAKARGPGEVPRIVRALADQASGDGGRALAARLFGARPGEVVVVPRLGALARLDLFTAAVDRVVAALPLRVRVVHGLVGP